jgi:hypothetical protein
MHYSSSAKNNLERKTKVVGITHAMQKYPLVSDCAQGLEQYLLKIMPDLGEKKESAGVARHTLNITAHQTSHRTYLHSPDAPQLLLKMSEDKSEQKMALFFPETVLSCEQRSNYDSSNVFEQSEYGTVQMLTGSDRDGFFDPSPHVHGMHMMLSSYGSNSIYACTFTPNHLGTDCVNKLLAHLGLEWKE